MKTKYTKEKIFTNIAETIMVGSGILLFSYAGYTVYEREIKPLFLENKKGLEIIVESGEVQDDKEKNENYLITKEKISKY